MNAPKASAKMERQIRERIERVTTASMPDNVHDPDDVTASLSALATVYAQCSQRSGISMEATLEAVRMAWVAPS
jgi:CRISPR/Cas system CSM-associated protein Csm2 small subunit